MRAEELWSKLSHIRPDGTSYNTTDSGYAETMAVLPAFYVLGGYDSIDGGMGAHLVYRSDTGVVSYAQTAQSAVNELMTCDALHRDTELNTWAHYSEAGFNFAPDGSGRMAQLFQY